MTMHATIPECIASLQSLWISHNKVQHLMFFSHACMCFLLSLNVNHIYDIMQELVLIYITGKCVSFGTRMFRTEKISDAVINDCQVIQGALLGTLIHFLASMRCCIKLRRSVSIPTQLLCLVEITESVLG